MGTSYQQRRHRGATLSMTSRSGALEGHREVCAGPPPKTMGQSHVTLGACSPTVCLTIGGGALVHSILMKM